MKVINVHILIVDDDRSYALELKKSLENVGIVDVVHSEEGFRKVFVPHKYDAILLDLRLKDGKEGLELLECIIQEDPSAVVIVISGYGDISTAVEALHKGAKTFLEKGVVSPHEIRLRIEQALQDSVVQRRIRQLESAQEGEEIVGSDTKIQKIKDLINLVALDAETTVLVRGETGTGKELVARAIYRRGLRNSGPFVTVALTEKNSETITSELFGHEKGAYTGALDRHFGYFEQAHKGVLFIDEIGDLPTDTQIKLLRVIEQKSFRRMGGKEDIHVDVQVVTATNQPLEEMVKEGKFREDLYYRLKVFEIHLSPLRERSGDIPVLANYFLQKLLLKGRTTSSSFADEAIYLLRGYCWPGNIRELKSVVESAALRAKLEKSRITTVEHISNTLISSQKLIMNENSDLFKTLAETELHLINDALKKVGGKKSEAWKLLNYPNRFLMLRRIKKIMNEYPDLADRYSEIKKNYIQDHRSAVDEHLNSR